MKDAALSDGLHSFGKALASLLSIIIISPRPSLSLNYGVADVSSGPVSKICSRRVGTDLFFTLLVVIP